jgi:hypothetical protein
MRPPTRHQTYCPLNQDMRCHLPDSNASPYYKSKLSLHKVSLLSSLIWIWRAHTLYYDNGIMCSGKHESTTSDKNKCASSNNLRKRSTVPTLSWQRVIIAQAKYHSTNGSSLRSANKPLFYKEVLQSLPPWTPPTHRQQWHTVKNQRRGE